MNDALAGSHHGVSSMNDTATAFSTLSSPSRSPVSNTATMRDDSSRTCFEPIDREVANPRHEDVEENLVEVGEVFLEDRLDLRSSGKQPPNEVVFG